MVWSSVIPAISVGAVAGFTLVAALVPGKPISITSVSISETGVLTFERQVRSDSIVYADFIRRVLDYDTNQTVVECGKALPQDFGPQEPQTQTYQLPPECLAALVPGTKYVPYVAVHPIDGPADTMQGEPFVLRP